MNARTIAALALLMLAYLFTTGCSVLQPAANQAAKVIKRYCAEVPIAERRTTRDAINIAAAPHHARIHCDGDPKVP